MKWFVPNWARRRLLNSEGGFFDHEGRSLDEVIGVSKRALSDAAHGRLVSKEDRAKIEAYYAERL